MGRPLREAKVVVGDTGSTTKTGPTGTVSVAGEQITMDAHIGGSSATATAMTQVSSRRFNITNAGGTKVCTLTAKASNAIANGECMLLLTDSQSKTYYASKITQNFVTIGALGTGSPTQFAVGTRVKLVDDQTSATVDETVQVPTA